MPTKRRALDDFDVQLLNELQRNAIATAESLAEKLSLSPSAIARRVRRLRGEGLICDHHAVLAPALIEDRLFAVVQVQLDEHTPEKGLSHLLRRIATRVEIQECAEISGEFDVLLLVCSKNMNEFNRLVDEELADSGAVRRYETTFVKKWRKRGQFVGLDRELP